jgi:hypothetical protein
LSEGTNESRINTVPTTVSSSLIDRAKSSLHDEVGTFTDDAEDQWLVMRWKRWCQFENSRGKLQGDPHTQTPWRKIKAEFSELEERGRSFNFKIGAEAYYAVRLVATLDEEQ